MANGQWGTVSHSPAHGARRVIALDARRLVRRRSGIGTYCLHLARHLPRLAPEFEFHLLVDRALEQGAVPEGCRQVVLGRFIGDGTAPAKLYSPFWLNLYVPDYLRRVRAVLFHGTNFTIPLRTRCKSVVTIHDLSFLRIPRAYGRIYRRYMKLQVVFALRSAAAVLTGSNSAKQDLMRVFRVNPERVTVIHHGVAEEFFRPHPAGYLQEVRERLDLPGRYILHVGVVEVKKNLIHLIRAGVNVVRQGLADALVLAGRDGLGADEIKKFAATSAAPKEVRFLGYVPQELLPGLYALARVVVFPSLYEGFGMPILEGMASGVPVIVSGSSSLPEVAGDAAFVVEHADASGLENAMRLILTGDSLREELRMRGLARAQGFRWEVSAAKHLEVYRRVLNV